VNGAGRGDSPIFRDTNGGKAMKAQNRVTGVVRALGAAGTLAAAALLLSLGWWAGVALVVIGGYELGVGVGQAVTGEDADE
jgi:hypothetical protein